jgi:hypothetical protein
MSISIVAEHAKFYDRLSKVYQSIEDARDVGSLDGGELVKPLRDKYKFLKNFYSADEIGCLLACLNNLEELLELESTS